MGSDNSLKQGWGGDGWIKRYVADAKQSDYGILVLDADETYFTSKPCCDEIYAAFKAGVNLTKIQNGDDLNDGKYLWVKFTEELFMSHNEYERTMKPRYGKRYTPCWMTVELGHFVNDGKLCGKLVTYYCVVPSKDSALARRTGACDQTFK